MTEATGARTSTVPGLVEHLRMRPGVSSARTSAGDTLLASSTGSERLGRLGPDERELLRRLAAAPLPVPLSPATTQESALLARLRAGGWLLCTVCHDDRPLYTLAPEQPPGTPEPTESRRVGPGENEPEEHGDEAVKAALSRFARLRPEPSGELVLESPLAWAVLRFHDPRMLSELALVGMTEDPDRPPGAVVRRLWHDLTWAGLAAGSDSAEDATLRSRMWSAEDLWFHRRTRDWRGADRFGRTGWAQGVFDPPPARRTPLPGPAIELPRPDLESLRRSDPPLTAVLEARQTVREYDDTRPLALEQLGFLLYRCARVRSLVEFDGYEYLTRPYPGAGAAHELEIYPVVRRMTGLDPGMYRYDPHRHRLEPVNAPERPVRQMLRAAATATGSPAGPQVLLMISARFGRIMWAYEQIPYSLILKNVGVLYQMLYTVATAMGLAACALGTGDSLLFSRATGMDPLVEDGVGEFSLGTAPPTGPSGESR